MSSLVKDVMSRDYPDLALQDAASDLALAHERVASLEADVIAYRELARATMDALQAVTVRCDHLRQQYDELDRQYRWLREECLLARPRARRPGAAPGARGRSSDEPAQARKVS